MTLQSFMKSALAGLFAVALAFATATAADAKPNQSTSNGCTIAQIQSPAASKCMAQLDQDVMSGAAYPHVLFCDAGGMKCCQSDGSRTFNCKSVSALKRLLSPLLNSPGTNLSPAN